MEGTTALIFVARDAGYLEGALIGGNLYAVQFVRVVAVYGDEAGGWHRGHSDSSSPYAHCVVVNE